MLGCAARDFGAIKALSWPAPEFNHVMIIDCHGHYTTEPPQLKAYRERQKERVAKVPFHRAEAVDLLVDVMPIENILFASEMVGAVRGIDPETGHYFDDTKRFIMSNKNLSEADRMQIFEGNARRVYPKLAGLLDN